MIFRKDAIMLLYPDTKKHNSGSFCLGVQNMCINNKNWENKLSIYIQSFLKGILSWGKYDNLVTVEWIIVEGLISL